jgi:hypothetical protein
VPSTIIVICHCLVWLIIKCVILKQPKVPQAIPWLRAIVNGLPPWRPSFDPGPAHVRILVDIVALGHFCPYVLCLLLSVPFHHCSIFIFCSSTTNDV